MEFDWGSLFSGAGSFGGTLGQNSLFNKGRRNSRRRGSLLAQRQRNALHDLFGQQEQVLKGRHSMIKDQFGLAQKRLGTAEVAGRQGILDREQMGMGAITSAQAGRGFSGSSDANLRRALIGDTGRALSSFGAQVGQMRAQLDTGQASAEAAAMGDLATHYGLRYAAESDIFGIEQSLFGAGSQAPTHWSQGMDWAGIGQSFNNAMGGEGSSGDDFMTMLMSLFGG